MKFIINERHSDALFEGTSQVYGSGSSPFVYFVENLHSENVDEDTVRFTTGLDKEDVMSNQCLSEIERAAYLKELPSVQKRITAKFGEKALLGTNKTFWKSRSSFVINNNTFSEVRDTDNIEDLILLWQIRGGGLQSIASGIDSAVMRGMRFYISTTEEKMSNQITEKFGDKRKAFALLTDLLDKSDRDGLLWVCWTLSSTVDQLKGFTKKTSNQTYENILTEYIEGTYTKNQYGKKQSAENFVNAYNEYKLTPDIFIVKAVLLAAYHFGKISYAMGKYYYNDASLEMASSIEESVSVLLRPENSEKYKDLSASVEKALNK